MFGLGVNKLGATNQKPFSPASLFSNGEAGVWYDPSAASGSLDWRRNLLEYTESFDNSYWNKGLNSTLTPNYGAAPDGNQTAYRLQMPTSGGTYFRADNVSVVVGKKYTFSIYAKSVSGTSDFDMFNQVSGTYVQSGTKTATSEWQRFSFTTSAAVATASRGFGINNFDDSYATDILIWGWQVEEASAASSYQPILSTFENAFKAANPKHTLYQDYQGLTPVTAVGEPVGLMLDKSEGLKRGPELVTNGDFSNGTTGWTAQSGWAVANGVATCSSGSTYLYQVTGIPANTWVTATVEITDYTSGTLRLGSTGFAPTQFFSGLGKHSITFKTWASVGGVELRSNSFVGTVDNISVTEIQGSHATQPTSTKRPIYARHPEGGIRNLLNYTEQFDNGFWSKQDSTITANAVIAPDGTQTADNYAHTGDNAHLARTTTGLVNGDTYTVSIYVKKNNNRWFRISSSEAIFSVWFDLDNGVVGTANGTSTNAITSVGNGWYRCTCTFATANTAHSFYIMNAVANGSSAEASGNASYIWGAQLEEANEATGYQKVVDDYDITESGYKSVYYLQFDGVDDTMSVSPISSTDAPISVFMGHDTSGNGSTVGYFLDIQDGRFLLAGAGYYTTASNWQNGTNIDATAKGVSTVVSDGTNANYRRDGIVERTGALANVSIQGDISIFSRYDYITQLTNGNMYQLVVRGATSTDKEIDQAEEFVAIKTGLKSEVVGLATLDLNFGANTYTARNSNGGVI